LSQGAASITAKTTANNSGGTSVVGSLSIGAGLKLDLTNNDLILNYSNGNVADPTKTAFVRQLITSGYANGAWNGAGLVSSSSAAVAANNADAFKSALGYAEASAAGMTTTFDGIPVDGDMVVVRYTYVGDANLNGTVNSADFSLLAANFNKSAAGWVDGDFNYDGIVNALDFNALASNFGATGAVPSSGGALGSLVPEPATAALAAGLIGLSQLRRRRSRA
jgi:hypothetical protein